MEDMLKDLIKTSKSGHSYTKDLDMMMTVIKDMVARWGFAQIEPVIEAYLVDEERNQDENPKTA
jgi:recombinational DNA repair protein RecT